MPRRRQSEEGESLAGTASEQVRAIIEAAEATAAQIRAGAEADADRIRAQAESEAGGVRAEARGEISSLLESLRGGLSRLGGDLERLEQKLSEPPVRPMPAPAPPRRPPAPKAPAPASGRDEDLEAARLVALNMALDSKSREDVDRYLEENFELADRAGLLDEVYASVGG
jgi:hypothetical protein